MKRSLFSLLIANLLAISCSMAADIVLADFDDATSRPMVLSKWSAGGVIYQTTATIPVYEIAANPLSTGINQSPYCMKVGQVANAHYWPNLSGIQASCLNETGCTGIPITTGNHFLKLFVLRSVNTVDFDVWISTVEHPGNPSKSGIEDTYRAFRGKVPAAQVGKWYELIIDLTNVFDEVAAQNVNLVGQHIRSVVIINSDNWSGSLVTPATTFYYDNFVLSDNPNSLRQIDVNPATTYQTIEGFGASDCWAGNFVGQNFASAEKEKVAKWLFDSSFNSDGSVNGIGLSIWRFNLGAGSYRQGTSSYIYQASRRADSYLVSHNGGNRIFDWNNRHVGQEWFLKQAYDYGCRNFLAFAVSPPIAYTYNGFAFANANWGVKANLNWNAMEGNGAAYNWSAYYWTDCLKHFQQDLGIPFHYISPLNEPQWTWQSEGPGFSQEGCSYTSDEAAWMCRFLNTQLLAQKLPTKILLGEAATWEYAYTKNENTQTGNQIAAYNWYGGGSNPYYIANLPTLEPAYSAHSYFTCTDSVTLASNRASAKYTADYYGIKLHQTEWSMMEQLPQDAPFSGGPWSSTSQNDIALYMARVIHSDLAIAGVSSWSYWTAMDPDAYGWGEDRFYLLAINPPYQGMTNQQLYDLNYTGTISTAETLWALGNYSLFIRPGYKRCALTGASELRGLMGTAYIAPNKSKLVAVYVNLKTTAQEVSHVLTNIPGYKYTSVDIYQTNLTSKLQKVYSKEYSPGAPLSIGARSVTTVVYTLTHETDVTANDIILADFDDSYDLMELAKNPDNKAIAQGSMITQYDKFPNPQIDGINPSPYCMRVVQAKDADWWPNLSGIAIPGINSASDIGTGRGVEVTATNHFLKAFILRNSNLTDFDIWITTEENYSGTDYSKSGVGTTYMAYRGNFTWVELGQWKDLVMDLTPLIGQHIRSIVIVNSDNWNTPRIPTPVTTSYYDNFVLSDNATPRLTVYEREAGLRSATSIDVKEKEDNLLKVSNSGKNTVDVTTTSDAKITILNSMGQTVTAGQTKAGVSQQFNVGNTGIYIIVAETSTSKKTVKVLIL